MVTMENTPEFYKTSNYRCLVYPQKQLEEISLLMCGIESCLPCHEFHTEGREGYHLHVVLKGKGVLSVDGKTSALHGGQMFITKPGEDTWYRANKTDPWYYCWMTYDGSKARQVTEATGFSAGVNILNCQINPMQFYTLVKRALDHASVNLSGDLYRLGYLLEFLALAIESAVQTGVSQKHTPEYNSAVYVDYAVKYFESDYANITVNDVARLIGINRSYLTAIFKKRMGVSPQEYLMRCRMEHARALLAESDLPVQDIALRIGYENAMTFSRIFKTYFGLSPRNYRLDLSKTPGIPEDEQKEEKTP